uniref:Secreted protein n=1 Tax=Macrostomum lignano TaxID=282301 RepID=A0A1I8F572_9PLAT
MLAACLATTRNTETASCTARRSLVPLNSLQLAICGSWQRGRALRRIECWSVRPAAAGGLSDRALGPTHGVRSSVDDDDEERRKIKDTGQQLGSCRCSMLDKLLQRMRSLRGLT